MAIRCFVALDLPDDVRAALAVPLDPAWRPVAAPSLHITVAFLGSLDESVLEALTAALTAALAVAGSARPAAGSARPAAGSARPVAGSARPAPRLGPLTTTAAVVLPPRRPRVLAIRLDDPEGTSIALQSAVSTALAAADLYEPERRRWLPHVTLARARGQVPRKAPLPDIPRLTFTPPALTLYRSRLGGNQPATYEPLARFPLA